MSSVVPYTSRPPAAANAAPGFSELAPAVRDSFALWPFADALSRAIADTDFVPRALRGKPAAIAAAMLYGKEVGLEPMRSLSMIAVVDGRPSLYAEAQRALILAAGHEIWVEEASLTKVTVAGRRRDSEQISRFTWTLDDAKRAGLAGKPTWRSYPRQMLLARASAELARAVFADAIGGLAATEELADIDAPTTDSAGLLETGQPEQQRRAARRRRRPAATPPAVDVQQPAPGEELPPAPGEQPEAAMTPAQQRRMQALFRENGISERADRLLYVRDLLDREIASSSELTFSEASLVINALADAQQTGDTDPRPDDEPVVADTERDQHREDAAEQTELPTNDDEPQPPGAYHEPDIEL
jgi:hypothetical protein